jgi:hypothetical protein
MKGVAMTRFEKFCKQQKSAGFVIEVDPHAGFIFVPSPDADLVFKLFVPMSRTQTAHASPDAMGNYLADITLPVSIQ